MKDYTTDNTKETNILSVKSVLLCLLLIVAAWVLVFWQGVKTAVDIWIISEIFNHCLFVLPGVLYLIYLKRAELDVVDVKPNYFVLVLCVGSLFLYAIGLAGDVQLFMHVATFTFLPLSIWAFIGNRLAYKILFPLAFILFCIPIGEELIPALQEVTTDLSMVMLGWSGIPVYRSGLYIEIPQGQFLVAEACSGISFFIASIVIGSLYAYLNMQSAKRRIVFMGISILFPIIANAIRVFGIILTGYLTDMEHAVGADHLIYGWVFFSLVIVCLLGIGELIREKQLTANASESESRSTAVFNVKTCYRSSISIVALMLVFFVWFNSISTQLTVPATEHNLSDSLEAEQQASNAHNNNAWKPEFNQPYQEFQFVRQLNNVPVDIYMVWYPKGQGELISSLNRLYPEKAWTLESKSSYMLNDGQNMGLSTIVNPRGKRLLSYWYVVDGKMFTNNRMAKLYEIYRILIGSYVGSGLVAISQVTSNTTESQDLISFAKLTQDALSELNQNFIFE
ncbi:exosortase A [uncultured Paraglaciecola sp.]|uniref:exosortase A n=1 Tax=uncultured Paraglaciecola sp. TaxID=1765024 RepID=UPI0030D97793